MQLTPDVLKTIEAIEATLYNDDMLADDIDALPLDMDDADDDTNAPDVWRGVMLLTLTFVLVGVALWAGV